MKEKGLCFWVGVSWNVSRPRGGGGLHFDASPCGRQAKLKRLLVCVTHGSKQQPSCIPRDAVNIDEGYSRESVWSC